MIWGPGSGPPSRAHNLRAPTSFGCPGATRNMFPRSNRPWFAPCSVMVVPQVAKISTMSRASAEELRLRNRQGMRRTPGMVLVNPHGHPERGGTGYLPRERERVVKLYLDGERDRGTGHVREDGKLGKQAPFWRCPGNRAGKQAREAARCTTLHVSLAHGTTSEVWKAMCLFGAHPLSALLVCSSGIASRR